MLTPRSNGHAPLLDVIAAEDIVRTSSSSSASGRPYNGTGSVILLAIGFSLVFMAFGTAQVL
jgi:hypothetical protein